MTVASGIPSLENSVAHHDRNRWEGAEWTPGQDAVIVEEPMEIQLQGHSIAVLMRTPGHDEDLVLGFLMTEGIIKDSSEVTRIQTCTQVPFPEAEENILNVSVRSKKPLWKDHKRNFFASSSCGICGKGSIDAVMTLMPAPLTQTPDFSPEQILSFPVQLQKHQDYFRDTGGCHGAALFDHDGQLILTREDVGRHNAVDKLIGASVKANTPLRESGLFVSGRISFEIVQKAAMAGIGWIGGVSAPSSLAVKTARKLGMTLIGFCRAGRFTQFTSLTLKR